MSESPYIIGTVHQPFVQARDRPPTTSRAEMFVGGTPWTDYASGLQVDNSGDEGGTTVTFLTRRPLERHVDDEVLITLDDHPYFRGTLKRPGQESGSRWQQTAVALGPFAEMAGQFFTQQVSYTNSTLRLALLDIYRRSSTVGGFGDVIGGDDLNIVEADYTKETSLSEGARGLVEPFNFVLLDRQGGNKLAMRKPRPGQAGADVATYGPDDYEEGEFTIDWTATQPYAKVDVYRRNEDDSGYDVRDVRDVELGPGANARARRNRWWFVPDWPGDQQSATREAVQISRELMQTGKFTLTVRLDNRPWRYDSFTGWRVVETETGKVAEWLDLVATDGVAADFTEETMTLSGDALRRRSVPFQDGTDSPPPALSDPSPYLIGG